MFNAASAVLYKDTNIIQIASEYCQIILRVVTLLRFSSCTNLSDCIKIIPYILSTISGMMISFGRSEHLKSSYIGMSTCQIPGDSR